MKHAKPQHRGSCKLRTRLLTTEVNCKRSTNMQVESITAETMTAGINELVASYEADNIPRKEINAGYCADFADVLWTDILGRPKDVGFVALYEDGAGHTWLIHKDRHYDAETPEGVEDWKDLPIWQRITPPNKPLEMG